MVRIAYIQSLGGYIHIYEEKMPYTVKALVSAHDDEYTICLNQDLSDQAKEEAVKHEMQHIQNNDLHMEGSAVEKERKQKEL